MNLPPEVAEPIVDAIIADLQDRRGLKQEWDSLDPDIQEDIKETWMIIAMHFGG